MPSYPCSVCGKSINMPSAWRRKSTYVFCSDECRNTPIVSCQCVVCGNTYLERAQFAGRARFCSNDCFQKYNRDLKVHQRYATYKLTCDKCGKEFSVRKNQSDVQRYCSRRCAKQSNPLVGERNPKFKPKVQVTCAYCGVRFETYPSRTARKYCCFAHSLIGNMQRFASGQRTSIEIKMAQALDNAQIAYTAQVLMFEKFLVDFLLSDYHIIVQCDGEYWHNRKGAKARDKGQDSYFRNAGYLVLRFTDKEINSNIDACIQKINSVIPGRNG